jgi:hypothetical protein
MTCRLLVANLSALTNFAVAAYLDIDIVQERELHSARSRALTSQNWRATQSRVYMTCSVRPA